MKINLTKEETQELLQDNFILIVRKGFEISITKDDFSESGFDIQVVNPYEDVILKK